MDKIMSTIIKIIIIKLVIMMITSINPIEQVSHYISHPIYLGCTWFESQSLIEIYPVLFQALQKI